MISVAIMAHPARERFVGELADALPEAEVVWDQGKGRWDTGARAMGAYDPAASHHLVVQDDAVLSRELVGACEALSEHSLDRVVALYMGGARPYADRVVPALQRAKRLGASFIEGGGPWWGVGVLFPTEQIDDCLAWGRRRESIENWDLRVGTWYRIQRRKCLYTVPSLVDHRPVAENPSLVPGRTANRRARYFIGAERSGTEIDWGRGIVGMDDKVRFRHARTGREATARPHTTHYARLDHSKLWEPVTDLDRLRQLDARVA